MATSATLAERRLGKLQSELAFTSVDEVVTGGLHEFIDSLQIKLNEVGEAICDTFCAISPRAPAGESLEA